MKLPIVVEQKNIEKKNIEKKNIEKKKTEAVDNGQRYVKARNCAIR